MFAMIICTSHRHIKFERYLIYHSIAVTTQYLDSVVCISFVLEFIEISIVILITRS